MSSRFFLALSRKVISQRHITFCCVLAISSANLFNPLAGHSVHLRASPLSFSLMYKEPTLRGSSDISVSQVSLPIAGVSLSEMTVGFSCLIL
jgi:hypothetical protein